MRTQIVVLKVSQKDDSPGHRVPAAWDWTDLTGDSVEVIASGPMIEEKE